MRAYRITRISTTAGELDATLQTLRFIIAHKQTKYSRQQKYRRSNHETNPLGIYIAEIPSRLIASFPKREGALHQCLSSSSSGAGIEASDIAQSDDATARIEKTPGWEC